MLEFQPLVPESSGALPAGRTPRSPARCGSPRGFSGHVREWVSVQGHTAGEPGGPPGPELPVHVAAPLRPRPSCPAMLVLLATVGRAAGAVAVAASGGQSCGTGAPRGIKASPGHGTVVPLFF